MPRTIPAGLATHLATGNTSLSLLVLLVRSDGTRYGFTSSDKAISYNGDSYEPSDGGAMTSIQQSVGTGIDNADFAGILTSARITEDDVLAGRFDRAKVSIYLINRNNTADGAVLLAAGYLGQITLANGAFQAEFRSLSQLLRQTVGDVTSKQCRVLRLGDAQCKVNMAGNTADGYAIRQSKTVSSVVDSLNLRFGSTSTPTGYYDYGTVKFTTGPNAGLTREVKTHVKNGTTAEIELRQAFPFTVTPGDTATLEIGCDRSHDVCKNRFSNVTNYRGEPHLPGNKQVTKVGRPPSSS